LVNLSQIQIKAAGEKMISNRDMKILVEQYSSTTISQLKTFLSSRTNYCTMGILAFLPIQTPTSIFLPDMFTILLKHSKICINMTKTVRTYHRVVPTSAIKHMVGKTLQI